MRCPECGANGYSRKTKPPERRCSKCGHQWDVAPDNPSPTDLLGLTPIALTPNTPRLATLRLLNFIASVVVFGIVVAVVFYIQSLVFAPLMMALGWYPHQQPPGESTPAMFYISMLIRAIIIIVIALFAASRVHAALGRRIDPSG